MNNRVTTKALDAQVKQMNEDLEFHQPHHKLHYAYGGVKLMVEQPSGGYIDTFRSGYVTKRDLSNRIDAYERGMQL